MTLKSKSRVTYAMRNTSYGMISQVVTIILGFVSRKIFIETLGVNFLGISGLFTNILTMLSLAELGVGGAITYSLYKPLAESNGKRIAALMRLYKNAYRCIGICVAILGLLAMLLLPYLIKGNKFDITFLRVIFLLFLFDSVSSYFLAYKQALLSASQQEYIITNAGTITSIILILVRMVALLLYRNYILYLLLGIFANIIRNVILSKLIDKKFPEILQYKNEQLQKSETRLVFRDMKNLSVQSVASFIVNSTDNLIISTFVGVTTLGLYSNYELLFSSVKNFVVYIVNATRAGLGNLVVSENKETVSVVMSRLDYLCFYIASFCSVSFLSLSNDFILMVFGKEYVLLDTTLLVCAINFYIWTVIRPLWQLSQVSGLFRENKYIAICEMIINLVASILLVNVMGLPGVFWGTTASYLVAWIFRSRLMFKEFLEKSISKYWLKQSGYIVITLGEVILVNLISKLLPDAVLANFILKCALCVLIPNLLNWILFCKTEPCQYFVVLAQGIVNKVLARGVRR